MKPNNPLDPLDLAPPRRPGLTWPWLVLLFGLGGLLLWLLLARSNAVEDGGVREGALRSEGRARPGPSMGASLCLPSRIDPLRGVA